MPGTKVSNGGRRQQQRSYPSGPTRLQLSLQHAAAAAASSHDESTMMPSIGHWIQSASAELAGSVAGLGGDWVLIDCASTKIHESADLAALVDAVVAAGASPVVRVPGGGGESKRVRRALECGAHGVMAACETKAQAEHLVIAAASFCASPRIVVVAEITSQTAVDNADAIAAVPGIDALFVGPFSSKVHGTCRPAAAAASADAVLAAAARHAKFAGHFAADAAAAARLARQGWHFVSCGSGSSSGSDTDSALATRTGVARQQREQKEEKNAPAAVEARLSSELEPAGEVRGAEYEWDGKDWG